MTRKHLPAKDRRNRTLDATVKAFAQGGFSGTTSRTLAKEAGISEAMLFKLFGSKRGLYRAIVKRKIEATGEAIFPREAAAREDDAAVFGTVGRALLASMEADPTFARLLLYSALEGADFSDIFYERRVSKIVDFLARYIRRRARKGAFAPGDPHVSALLFIGMIVQFALVRQVFGIRRYRRANGGGVVDLAVRIFLKGLRRKSAKEKRP